MEPTGRLPAILAYIDPGTGSFFIQMLLAGVAGVAGVVALYWKRFKAFFAARRSSERKEQDGSDSAPTPEP